nr:hypothetical protein BaRGS_000435 [Batillaria attramentaria]
MRHVPAGLLTLRHYPRGEIGEQRDYLDEKFLSTTVSLLSDDTAIPLPSPLPQGPLFNFGPDGFEFESVPKKRSYSDSSAYSTKKPAQKLPGEGKELTQQVPKGKDPVDVYEFDDTGKVDVYEFDDTGKVDVYEFDDSGKVDVYQVDNTGKVNVSEFDDVGKVDVSEFDDSG